MKKVLIISYSFPPHNEIASRRYAEMCPYFSENGWEPYVLTTLSNGDIEVPLQNDQLIRVGVHPGLNLHIKKNKNIKSYIADFRRKLGFVFRVFDSALFNWSNQIITSSEVLQIIKEKDFDLIIASYGPSSVLRIGSYLGSRLNIPVIYDFRDLASLHESEGYYQNWIAKKIDIFFEKRYLNKRAGIITVSKGLAEKIEQVYKEDVAVIYNGWSDQVNSSLYKLPTTEKYLYYAGRFYNRQMKAIFLIIDALVDVNYELVIRSLGPVGLEEQILAYVKEKGLADRVKILPKAPATVIDFETKNAVINVVIESLEKKFKSERGILTGKFLQLLTYQSPVLAVARDDSEIGEILNDTGKGKLCSTTTEIKNFFKIHSNVEDKLNSKNISKYSKKEQVKILVQYMNKKIEA